MLLPRVGVLIVATVLGARAADLRVIGGVKSGDADAIRALIVRGASVNGAEADGTTALHWAILAGNFDAAKLLVRAGAHVNAANRYGVTPLALAALNGDARATNLLLSAGASVDLAPPGGETPLMTAALTGRPEVVEALLSHGARVNAKEDFQGQTALMWAAAENHAEVVRLLAAHGADPNARAKVLERPKREIVDSRTDKDGLALQVLLTTFPHGGLTPLLFASRQGSLAAAKALLEAGADPNLADPDGISPLMLALRNAHYDVAALLASDGANVNAADDAGRTALYIAVDMHSLDWIPNQPAPRSTGDLDSGDLIKLLLARAANPNAQLTAVPPVWKEAPPIQNAFTGVSGPGATPFIRAAKNGDLQVMTLLLENGADPNFATKNGTTALMALAGGLGRKQLAELNITDREEESAIEIATLLVARGANIEASDSLGQTALHGAAMIGASRFCRFLIERGARLDARDHAGLTPAEEAIRGIPNLDGVPGEPHPQTASVLNTLARGQLK